MKKHSYLALGLVALAAALIYRARRRRRGGYAPVTQAVVPVSPADTSLGRPGHNREERLDEALQETFPGSDPISIHIE